MRMGTGRVELGYKGGGGNFGTATLTTGHFGAWPSFIHKGGGGSILLLCYATQL